MLSPHQGHRGLAFNQKRDNQDHRANDEEDRHADPNGGQHPPPRPIDDMREFQNDEGNGKQSCESDAAR